MKKSDFFLSENFPFLVVKFSIYLNRRVFVMFPHFRGFKSTANCNTSITTAKSDCTKISIQANSWLIDLNPTKTESMLMHVSIEDFLWQTFVRHSGNIACPS